MSDIECIKGEEHQYRNYSAIPCVIRLRFGTRELAILLAVLTDLYRTEFPDFFLAVCRIPIFPIFIFRFLQFDLPDFRIFDVAIFV